MKKLVLLAPVLLALSLVGCGGGATTTPTGTTTPTATTTTTPPATTTTTTPPATTTTTTGIDAAALYAANCAVCHGANRQGTPPTFPPLTPTSLADDSVASIAQTITNGVNGTAMQPWGAKLSADQINALANFVKNVAP